MVTAEEDAGQHVLRHVQKIVLVVQAVVLDSAEVLVAMDVQDVLDVLAVEDVQDVLVAVDVLAAVRELVIKGVKIQLKPQIMMQYKQCQSFFWLQM